MESRDFDQIKAKSDSIVGLCRDKLDQYIVTTLHENTGRIVKCITIWFPELGEDFNITVHEYGITVGYGSVSGEVTLDFDADIIDIVSYILHDQKIFRYYYALLDISKNCDTMEDRSVDQPYLKGISDMAGTVRHIINKVHCIDL